MRTTVNVDDDVLLAVRERARREKRPAGEVLSDLARQSLTQSSRFDEPHGPTHHGFQVLPCRGATVSNALIDQLREDDPSS